MSAGGIRADIEGLRALAVLLVVAGHAGVPGFAGGYIGVDVFFVISGYLITHLLCREYEQSATLDLAGFYARRVRRLLPAFAVLLVMVLLGVYVLSSPLEQPGFIRSILAAALYISNLHFAWQTTDYWADSAKQDPLLHTWSLGVEEQFYLVWPLVLFLMFKGAARFQRPVFVVVMLLSFSLAVLWVYTSPPHAFFSPLSRAWEFGAGAALVIFSGELQKISARLGMDRWRTVAELFGLLLIFTTALFYDGSTTFPGIAAMPPVIGAALIIAAGTNASASPHGRKSILSLPPMQWIGRQSYGWYLWHWPVLVFGLMLIPDASLLLKMLLVTAALLPAYLSYRLVETPVRTMPIFASRKLALAILIAIPATMLSAGMMIGQLAEERRTSPEYESLMATRGRVPSLYIQGCDPGFYDATARPCIGGATASQKTMILVGDSHAGQWASAFDAIAKQNDWRLLMYTKSACPMVDQPFFHEMLGRTYRECDEWRRNVMEKIASLKPELVVMSNSEAYPFTASQWEQGELRVAGMVSQSSQKTVILRDSPLPGFNIPHCLARKIWQPRLYPNDCNFVSGNANLPWIDAIHRKVAAHSENIVYLDLSHTICAENICNVVDGSIVKFRDGNHLSDHYVQKITPAIDATLRQKDLL